LRIRAAFPARFRWALAYRHLAVACDVAARSGQTTLHASALGAVSYLFSSAPRGGQGGQPQRALDLLNQALRIAPRSDGFTRGWLATWRGDQHATLGDLRSADADVRAAEACLASADDGIAGFFSRGTYGYGMDGHLGSVRGVVLALAGDADESERAFAAVQASAANMRRRIATDGHLALVRAGAGDAETACHALARSITLAAEEHYPMGLKRAAGVRARFDPAWSGLPHVREIDERLRLAAA
jgi:hypothetical protein